ncbi:MAG: sulfatase-like hydrolase/transferase, partial [Thermoplasmata archaeon]|nr:sulfatase-like hydrolase/transferase [Thermoplasmata archaeon]
LRSEFDVHHPPPEKDENGVYINIEEHLGRRERRYLEEIEFIGAQIKRLTELSDIDLLVITADHGEKMQGEKGYPWVSNHRGESVGSHFHEVELFDHQLLVPLIFWGKDIARAKLGNMVRTVDITPTILEMIGHMDGKLDKMDGVSLKSQISGGGAPLIEDAYSETYFAQMHAKNQHASEMNEKYRWGWKAIDNLVSLRTPTHKLICLANGQLEPTHLYDLYRDPGETENLISKGTHGPLISALFSRLKEMIGDDHQFMIGSSQAESSRVRAAIGKLKLK